MSFEFLPAGQVRLHGPLGAMLDNVVKNRLLKVDFKQLVDPFRYRNESDGKWRCEFWGKVIRSAIYAWRSTQDPELKQRIDATVEDLLSTQTTDGCISSYPEEKQLGGWDIWGRKYVLLGLLAYYQEMNQEPAVLEKIRKCCLHLVKQAGPLQDYGQHFGMAAASVLRAIIEIAYLCKDDELMTAAKKLAKSGCCQVHDIFAAARIGVSPAELSNAKAYEMTSCFQGLGALYLLDHDEEKLESLKEYYRLTEEKEIFITGGGGLKDSNGEFWYNGTARQYRTDCGGMGETCITATWLWFSRQMLQLTGDSTIADNMERSFYNALLGAFTPDGTNVTHINPFLCGGWKQTSGEQIAGFPNHDCCRAQGPYGLSLAPLTAVMKTENGYAVCLYEDLEAKGILSISGNYPVNNRITVTVEQDGEYEFAFRVPSGFGCKIGNIKPAPGTFYRIHKHWEKGEIILIEFDFEIREKTLDGKHAYCRGPLVLCREQNAEPESTYLFCGDGRVDYASAGKKFAAENTLTVWE